VKATLLFLACLVLSSSAFGDDKADKKLAIEYLKMARFEQIMNATADSYSQSMFKEMSSEDRAKFKEAMNASMGWEATKDQLADIVIKVYTKQELNASIAYMKSKLGASMTAKGEKFSSLMASQMSGNFQKFMQEHPIQPNAPVKPGAERPKENGT
jgi:hypothetical protein